MPPANPQCPECDPLQEQHYQMGVRITDLNSQIDPLRKSLEDSLEAPAERLRAATEARLQAEAEHAYWVTTAATMVADISAMTGAGATAVASAFANDMSFTPIEGWIEHQVSPTLTLWFRNEQAITNFGAASSLQAALDGLARARAEEARTLQEVRDANRRESDAENEFDDAVARAEQTMQDHYDEIARCEAEHRRLYEAYLACLDRCKRGEQVDERVGIVGVAMMLAGLLLIAIGNPFGFGQAEAATDAEPTAVATASTAVAIGSPTTTGTPTPTPQPAQVGPIGATFNPPGQATYYHLPIVLGPGEPTPPIEWSGADCGEFGPNGASGFFWHHPHPPCDPTSDHSTRTIRAVVELNGQTYTCQYQGAASGFGPGCAGPGGSTVAIAPGGDLQTPIPTLVATTSTPAPTVAVPSSTPATPTATPTPATGGGGTTARPPTSTPTAAPTAEGGNDDGGGSGSAAATAAGMGLTAAGGAAVGYATSRRGGTRTRDEDEGEDDEGGGGTRTRERPCVEIDTSGAGTDSVTREQPFRVRVQRPRPPSGDPPETIDIKFRSVQTGAEETLRLRWSGNVTGPARYESEQVTIKDGGSGGGTFTVPLPLTNGLAFSTGDMGDDLEDVPSGSQVEITIDGCSTQFTVYNTWVQQGIGRALESIRLYRQYWTNVAILLQSEPDSPEKESLLRNAREVIRLADEANRIDGLDWLHTRKLAYLRSIAGLVRGDLSNYDRRDEYQTFAAAERSAQEMSMDSFMRGLQGAAIGMWRTAADVTGYASFVKARYGVDEMGAKVGTMERIFAVLDLAGKMTMYGATRASIGSLADEISGAGRALRGTRAAANASSSTPRPPGPPDVPSANWRAGQLIPDRPPVPTGAAARPLTAPAGTRVAFPEEFGMLRNRARHFQSVVERFLVRIRVRPANIDALDWMSQGHPPKHVKLKSKTINNIDEILGAKPGSQGLVGYFEPKMPPRGTFTDTEWAEITKRYNQRLAEYGDQSKAMNALIEKGLVRVDDGVVIDTGLSDMRVPDLETGKMVPRSPSVPDHPSGTGKAFTGDHDMWDITRPDGSPLDPSTKAALEAELMDGTAATQHGPHKDWVPKTDVDRGIDAKIRGSHLGQTGADGAVTPAQGAEGLIEFTPGQSPRVSYEMDAGVQR